MAKNSLIARSRYIQGRATCESRAAINECFVSVILCIRFFFVDKEII